MLFGCNAEVFDGNSVKNRDNFFLRFTRMSKTDAHIINAEAGDVISVELEIEKGRVDIVIGAEGDEPIYVGMWIRESLTFRFQPQDNTRPQDNTK